MDEFNESENSQPIEGQICYDELEPIVEEKEEKFEANLDGQIGFDDFLNSRIGEPPVFVWEREAADGSEKDSAGSETVSAV